MGNVFRASFALLGFAQGGELATAGIIVVSHVKSDRLGLANGVLDASGALARVIAPLAMASLYTASWYISTALAALAIPLMFVVPPEHVFEDDDGEDEAISMTGDRRSSMKRKSTIQRESSSESGAGQ